MLIIRNTSSCTTAGNFIAYFIMQLVFGRSKVFAFFVPAISSSTKTLLWKKSISIKATDKGLGKLSSNPANSTNISIPNHIDKRIYLSNPAVTATALAHVIWKSVIIPFTDTVIDATCGNGKDSVVLSDLLFNLPAGIPKQTDACSRFKPQLICIDVQKRACENTFRSLSNHIQDSSIVQNYIKILNTSHDPLPIPNQGGSVGLVCWNLGYLPGIQDKTSSNTQTYSTISSIRDAAIILRVGGLLSITMYPKTNPLEAETVRLLCEGLARISSRENGSWIDYVDQIPSTLTLENGANVRDTLRDTIQAVVSKNVEQSWRVFEHRPLGRGTSPTLITALRIK